MTRAVLAGLVFTWGAASASGQAIYKSGIDLVTVGVTVVDKKGNLIADLAPGDLEVYEDGRRQELRHFVRGDDIESGPPMHVGLLFDTSGSMDEDMSFSRTAAIKFLNLLPHAEDITLVDFDTEVRAARFSQSDFPRLVERLRTRDPEGWTALYDALGVYLDGASAQDGRKVLVLYTDGGDTRSAMTLPDAIELVKASDVTIYVIGFLEHQRATDRGQQLMRLRQIAELTGGRAFFPMSANELEAMYDAVLAEIDSQYSLGYVSTNTRLDGNWHKVEVKCLRPDLRDAKIRTRKGYYSLYRPSSH